MAPFLPFMFLSIYVAAFFHLSNFYSGRTLDQKAKERLYTHFADTLAGAQHIRAFDWGKKFEQDNLRLLDISQRPHFFLLCNHQSLCLIMDINVMAMGTTLVLLALFSPEACSKPALGFAFVALTMLSSRLPLFAHFATEMEVPISAMTRVQNFTIETPFEVDNRTGSVFARRVDKDWSSFGRLEFKGVSAPFKLVY